MLAPRSEVPRKSSPSYGASSQPLGSRRWSASALPLSAIIVRAAAIPSEYFRPDPALATVLLACVTSLLLRPRPLTGALLCHQRSEHHPLQLRVYFTSSD